MKYFIYIFFTLPFLSLSQNGASTPGVADNNPISLPYHKSNHTTVGKSNNAQDPGGIVNSYTSGNDYFYYYCPTSSGDITISLQYLSTSTGVAPYISVWDTDPSSAAASNLIADISSPGYSASTMNASLELVASLNAGTCYYIMIDNWPGPNGFQYDISVYDSPINSGCSNIGFESGLTNWTVTTGDVSKGKNADPHSFYEPTSFTISATKHKLVTAADGNDPVVGAAIPQLCPWGDSQSLRLGDGTSTGGKGATVEQRFSVTASNAMFNYYYAVVLEDPSGHSLQEKPMFKIDVLDCDGNALSCGEYLVVSSAPGFVSYNYGQGYYKEWTPVFLDLTAYIGSCVTVRFKTADCTLSGHYGYAYVDASCGPLEIEGPDTVCLGVPETISAPAGAASYSWTIQGDPTEIGTSEDLVISPTSNTTYECVLTSVTGCNSTIIQPIVVVTGPTVDDIVDQTVCGTYTLPTITGTNLTGNENYYDDSQANGGQILTGPITSTQTIWIYDNLTTCTSEESFTVTVNTTPTLTLTTPSICNSGLSTIQATVSPSSAYDYSWTVPTGVSDPGNVNNFTSNVPGTYTVSISNSNILCNTDFDNTVITSAGNYSIINQSSMPCWSTTASDNKIEVWGSGFNGVPAYSGNQFVELNANLVSTLYQDFTAIPNSSVTISFAHRGRNGTDVLSVEIGPVGGPYTNLGNFSAGNSSWEYNTVNYTFPNNGITNYTLRFNSVSAAGGATMGNFLDAISIVTSSCLPSPVSSTLIVTSIDINNPGNQTVCDSYTLPTITGTNLSGNENYYDDSQANGGNIIAGPITSTQTVWIYDINGSCSDEESFLVTVNQTPVITNPGDQIVCDSYTLPTISGTNLTGNKNYYDDSQANGGNIIAGPITSTKTVWIYDINGSCSDEESFLVTVNQTPVITNPGNQTVCDGYTLPTITGTNLSGNENYYDDSQANGGQILTGPITSTQTIWIYDANGSCSDEESFLVTVNQTPVITNPGNQTVCDSYTLPTITGSNLSGNENYYDDSQANGGNIITGPITSTQTVWIYDVNGSCSDEISFLVTVNLSPSISNNPGALTVCAPYTLPTITGTNLSGNENYYDDSQANGGQILTGPLNSSQTIWIYDSNNGCSDEESYALTVDNTPPSINNPGNQSTCNTYTLPTITGTNLSGNENYYDDSQANGGQILTGPISSTQTIWMFDQNGTCSSEESFTITVSTTPSITNPGNQIVCDSYSLPSITGSNLSGTENYYDNSQANGGNIITGPITSSQTIWIYDNYGSCSDETSFDITVNYTPTLNTPSDITICDSYSLNSITGTNLSGNESYYDNSQVNGGVIITGPITSSQTVWIYDADGACSDETSFNITINLTPSISNPGNQSVCDSYILPSITGNNLSGYENFYDDTQANGGQILTGPLTSSQTIWIYDNNGTCSDEENYTVTINYTPNLNNPGNIVVCDTYSLPVISGANLSGSENYYDNSKVNGGQILTGPLITSQTIWIYDEDGSCNDELSYTLTVNYTPVITVPGNQTICDSYNLPVISGTNLSGNENFYDDSQANGGNIITGTLTSSQTIWLYDNNGTCNDEQNYLLTVDYTPSLNSPGDQTICDSYNLPVISGSNLSGNENFYDDSQANGGNIITGPMTSSQMIWIYDSNNACSNELNFQLTVNYTPSITNPGNQTVCDSYNLPVISGTNLSGNENFYNDSQANGGQILTGPLTSSQMIWIYDEDGACNDETNYNLTVNYTPSLNSPGNQVECDAYTLPMITGINLSGNENFYDDSQANGGNIVSGPITSNQTIWLYDENGSCNDELNFDVTINITPTIDFSVDTTNGCLPLVVKFLNNSTPQYDQVNWDFGDGNTFNSSTEIDSINHTFDTENCFDIKLVASSNGCIDSLTKPSLICTYPKANAEFTVDSYSKTVANPFFEFYNLSTNASIFFWDFDDDETSIETAPQHEFPNDPRNYYITLIANNVYNCSDTTGQFIELKDELIYYIPNAFTPNDDEFNNTFKPVFYSGYEIEDYTLYIFNRWGQLIFESHDPAKGWNGRYGGNEGEYCPDEMYVWKIHFKETNTDKEHIISGHVILYK